MLILAALRISRSTPSWSGACISRPGIFSRAVKPAPVSLTIVGTTSRAPTCSIAPNQSRDEQPSTAFSTSAAGPSLAVVPMSGTWKLLKPARRGWHIRVSRRNKRPCRRLLTILSAVLKSRVSGVDRNARETTQSG